MDVTARGLIYVKARWHAIGQTDPHSANPCEEGYPRASTSVSGQSSRRGAPRTGS
jgi:hypothetical protein